MNDRNAPTLTKWPFYLADAILLALAFWVFLHYPHPLAPWAAGLMATCVIGAALIALWPIRTEYETAVRTFEADRLVTVTQTLRDLNQISQAIHQATGQWQGVQEHAGKTTQAAREIAERIASEARAFSEFMTKANDSEKSTLRLEVEKLRRGEGQWLQVLVHLLDHVHALYQAGMRSGQPNLAAQLGAFQTACRDLVRKVGLVPIDAEADQPFDVTQHDVVEGQVQPEGPTQVAQVVATGYSFQGQVLRKPIVVLRGPESTESTTLEPENTLGEAPVNVQEFDASATDITSELSTVTAVDGVSGEETLELVETGQSLESLENLETLETLENVETLETLEASEEFRLEADPLGEGERSKAGNA